MNRMTGEIGDIILFIAGSELNSRSNRSKKIEKIVGGILFQTCTYFMPSSQHPSDCKRQET
jgi:hypothetical protein